MKRKKITTELYVRYPGDAEAWVARRGISTDVEGFTTAAARLIEDGAAEVRIGYNGIGPAYTIEQYIGFEKEVTA